MLDEPSPPKPTTTTGQAVRLRPRDVETKVMGWGSVGCCGWDLGGVFLGHVDFLGDGNGGLKYFF